MHLRIFFFSETLDLLTNAFQNTNIILTKKFVFFLGGEGFSYIFRGLMAFLTYFFYSIDTKLKLKCIIYINTIISNSIIYSTYAYKYTSGRQCE